MTNALHNYAHTIINKTVLYLLKLKIYFKNISNPKQIIVYEQQICFLEKYTEKV